MGKKLFIILGFLLVVGFIVGFYFTYGKAKLTSKPKYFKIKPAQVSQSFVKTKKISKEGGGISLVDEKGTKISLIIPANALEKETEVSLASLTEIPIENYQPPINPGVILLPTNLKFKIPATLVFDFDPINDFPLSRTTGQPPSLGAPVGLPETEEFSETETQKRKTATRISFSKNSGIIFTNSTETSGGNTVFLSPSEKDFDRSKITTQTKEGGTFSFDKEITAQEARDFVNEVLNNPNATFEQILEAWKLAQQFGFEDIDEKAKGKLKEKMNEVIKEIKESCGQGKPVSKKEILDWQALAQALGFEKEEKELDELTRGCRGYYFLSIQQTGPVPGCTYTTNIAASVCGFIDDPWQATGADKVVCTLSDGSTGTQDIKYSFNFSLPRFGGKVPFSTMTTTTVCGGGNCSTVSHPVAGWVEYNGLDQVGIKLFWEVKWTKINYQKNCQ